MGGDAYPEGKVIVVKMYILVSRMLKSSLFAVLHSCDLSLENASINYVYGLSFF